MLSVLCATSNELSRLLASELTFLCVVDGPPQLGTSAVGWFRQSCAQVRGAGEESINSNRNSLAAIKVVLEKGFILLYIF